MLVKEVVPLLRVQNMERSLGYYVDGLGFEMKNKWVVDGKLRWCRLAMGGAALMIEGDKPWTPAGKAGQGVSLNFICDDAVAFYHDVRSRGIDASEPFVGNAMWVTQLTDPDGFRLCFESATEVAEETKLSEVAAI
jgi:uncharacterized glyoxalase superfamily protein PhnB